jgi:hypothetical protein
MDKKFLISGVAASLLIIILSYVVHAVLLTGDYMNYKNLFRTEEEAMGNMPWMILAHVIMGFSLAWIYKKGLEPGSPWLPQGIRFGIAVIMLVTVPWYLVYYSVQPWGRRVTVKQIVFDGIMLMIVSLVTAFIYREPSGPSES